MVSNDHSIIGSLSGGGRREGDRGLYFRKIGLIWPLLLVVRPPNPPPTTPVRVPMIQAAPVSLLLLAFLVVFFLIVAAASTIKSTRSCFAIDEQLLSLTHRPLSGSFLGLPYRVLNMSHNKELLRGLWVVPTSHGGSTARATRTQRRHPGNGLGAGWPLP